MKPKKNNPLASILVSYDDRPRTLISLWDMIQANAGIIIYTLENLEFLSDFLSDCEASADADPANKKAIRQVIRGVVPHLEALELKVSLDRSRTFQRMLRSHCSYQVACSEMKALRDSIRRELKQKRFAYIPEKKREFFENDALFGKAFKRKAPRQLSVELNSAGNCLAADLPTAAVFHVVRIAEFGLHKLASHLQSCGYSIVIPKTVEFSTWGEIIGVIDAELHRLKATQRTSARDVELQFYGSLIVQIRAIQYIWRDPVSHFRFDKPHEAENALNDVKRFMIELAKLVPLK